MIERPGGQKSLNQPGIRNWGAKKLENRIGSKKNHENRIGGKKAQKLNLEEKSMKTEFGGSNKTSNRPRSGSKKFEPLSKLRRSKKSNLTHRAEFKVGRI